MFKHKILYLVQLVGGSRCWYIALFFQGEFKGYAAVNLDSGGIHNKYYETPEDFEKEVREEGCRCQKVNEHLVISD